MCRSALLVSVDPDNTIDYVNPLIHCSLLAIPLLKVWTSVT